MSPTRSHRQEDDLGTGPLLSMLQHSSLARDERQENDAIPHVMIETFLPFYNAMSSNVASAAGAQMVQDKTFSFLDYMMNSYQNVNSFSQPQGLQYVKLKSLEDPNVDVAYASLIS
ncbi:unnamed protein product [Linum trigynum]|uniref:Uncharacterized protein n=1 Tax=Linum trigynum TaxID=586398 RepID=A0AAV2F8V4_9ROSI